MTSLSGKTALVTGASKGIGKAIALAYGKAGANVVATARTESEIEDVTNSIRGFGSKALGVIADLKLETDIAKLVNAAENEFGGVDILVNNAAIIPPGIPVLNFDPQLWRDIMDVNLTSAFLITQKLLPGMIDRGEGRIVMVSSVAGYLARGTYSAHKAWGLSIARSLHATHRRQGIHVSAVAPGFTRTEFHQRMEMKTDIFPEIMWLKASDVVRASLRGVELGKAVVIPSLRYKVLVALATVLPARVHQAGT